MGESYRKIPLTQNEYAIVDEDDYERVSQYRWTLRVHDGGRYKYALHRAGHAGKKGRMLMHRFIMDAPPGMVVDHINHDGLDNRKSNLRVVTSDDNMKNRRSNRGSRVQYKGVTYAPKRGVWLAEIRADGDRMYLGQYSDPKEAALAYDRAARTLHGEFGYLNFPDIEQGELVYRSLPARSRHGYRGIYKNGSGWGAEIRHKGQRYYLGCFSTAEEAAMAYDDAAVKFRGKRAIVNFPERYESND